MKPLFVVFAALFFTATAPQAAESLVLLNRDSAGDAGWKSAAVAMAEKYAGSASADWDQTEAGLLAHLREHQPRYLTILGKPQGFNAKLVRAINRATRNADPDPWTDCRWGMITGATPEDALRVIRTSEPLLTRRALCTTGINLNQVDSALVLSDAVAGKFTRKQAGGPAVESGWDEKASPEGTVGLFAEAWNNDKPQLLVTSSHATQFNLEMPWGYGLIASHGGKFHVVPKAKRNEFARFLGGAMFKGDEKELGAWIESLDAPVLRGCDDPKIWIAAGNCLIGDARGTSDSMVVSAMSSSGVRQLLGYVVPTWYGKNGWGALGLWQASHGRLDLSEAFFLNTQQMIERTVREFPGAENVDFDSDEIDGGLRHDRKFIEGLKALETKGVLKKENGKDVLGLIHDRDTVAFWGDPRWRARLPEPEEGAPLKESWIDKDGTLSLELSVANDFKGDYAVWLPRRVMMPAASSDEGAPGSLVCGKDFLLARDLEMKAGSTLRVAIRSKSPTAATKR